MAAQALYRKWRPRTFDEVVGQEHVVRTLRNALTSERIHHAYLFAGPRGTGKTTMARLLAKAVNCLAEEEQRPCNQCAICQAVNEGRLLDLIEIDAASNTGVDDVRELRERVGFRPNEARYKVYVIDEVHMLSNAAFNALLKTLEEPPPHAVFVLATTEPQKIPATVVSRCQRFDFRRLSVDQIVARLAWMTDREHIKADREALALVARQATGSMRDAESLLDQLASYESGEITVADVRAALGAGDSETVLRLVDALARGDVAEGLSVVNAVVDAGADPRQFARQVVEYLRSLLLLRLESGVSVPYISEDVLPQLEALAAQFSPGTLARAVRLFTRAAGEAKGGWQPQLPLEMALVEAGLEPQMDNPVSSRPSPPAGPDSSSSSPKARSVPALTASRRAPMSPAQPPETPMSVQEATSLYSNDLPADGPLTLQAVRDCWSQFLDALRPRNLPLEALMRSCEPLAVEGNAVVLGFTHDFHRSRVEEDQNKRDVEEVLSGLVGQRYRVRCVLSAQQRDARPSQPPASRSTPLPAGDQGAPPVSQDVIDDPLIRTAVEDLGAQIVRR